MQWPQRFIVHTGKYTNFTFTLKDWKNRNFFLLESVNVTGYVTFSSLFISVSMLEMVILCMMMSVILLSSDCHLVLAIRLR